MRSVDDDRTVNKSLHFRPESNLRSVNELASLWEKKIGRTLPRVVISENDLLASAAEMRIPQSVVAAFTHDVFIKGCQINFSMDKSGDIDICYLYPDITFKSISECFDEFYAKAVAGAPPEDETAKTIVFDEQPGENGIVLQPKAKTFVITATYA